MKRITIPRERLPEDAHLRHSVLRQYFCDKDATAAPVNSSWDIELSWTGGDDRHVDPALEAGLGGWGQIPEEDMWSARRQTGRVLVSLFDTWTMLAWSQWLASVPSELHDLTILHVDDHRDLGSPRLFQRGSTLVDPFTGQDFDLLDPSSVQSAIASGAVGMGSFLTPVLHRFPDARVRQLTQPPKVNMTVDYAFTLTSIEDDLIAPGELRPGIALTPPSNGGNSYRITNQVEDWLEDLGNGPILLHIDMDYFSNRYDGDTDWRSREEILDPTEQDVTSRIEGLGQALRERDLFPRIVSAAVAYSPGFFPAEYWNSANKALERALKELLA